VTSRIIMRGVASAALARASGRARAFTCALAAGLAGCAPATPAVTPAVTPASPARSGAPKLVVRNNHDLAYAGPLELPVALPDGDYAGGGSRAMVRDGVARLFATVAPASADTLRLGAPLASDAAAHGLELRPDGATLELRRGGAAITRVELGLLVIPDTTASVDDALRHFAPLAITWRPLPDGRLAGAAVQGDYRVSLTATPWREGVVDTRATLTRIDGGNARAYVALVRRVAGAGASAAAAPTAARLRYNGRVLDTASSPDSWSRDFWYTRGVDWASWNAGDANVTAISGFTPVPTIRTAKGAWAEGSYFYVRERTRAVGDAMFLVSEVAGPNAEQAKSRYMPVTTYAPMPRGDSLTVSWRLALRGAQPAAAARDASFEESQLFAFAGYRRARASVATHGAPSDTIDIGVPAVAFGTSYFPYSTFGENFDFYRSPGTNQETWWPIATGSWAQWRKFVPRMQTDLHIIRAMGFEWVRLHHLELLRQLESREAFAFLDWYMAQARALGLKVLVDSEGPAEWIAAIVSRYPDRVQRVEIENEILIGGVKPGDAERWTALYRATKAASPSADVFLTTAGNHGQFERLRTLGVPFDRVGLHAYKHGPEWQESFSSHALGTGGYASSLGMDATLGEFNWKEYTRFSPERRAALVRETYAQVLAPRALPELFEFHFQETMSISPAISRSGVRHYEPFFLDRRLKPEGKVLRDAIRRYARADAPVRVLPIEIGEVRLMSGRAEAGFRLRNASGHPVTVRLSAVAFDGLQPSLLSPAEFVLAPDEVRDGRASLRLPGDSLPGTYQWFLRATYDAGEAIGWGVAANPGAPRAGAPVLGDRVRYPDGDDVLARLDWERPIAVTFGAKAHWLEMEMAYLLGNTLQAATGRPVRISSADDLLPAHARDGLVVAVGTAAANPLVAEASVPVPAAQGTEATGGVVALRTMGGAQRLVITGATRQAVEAAAMDLMLRYWPQAKDAALRLTGSEPGQLLGHRAGVTNPDPP
jgi:hypothetical protein